jgi:hypothetical protein
MCGCTVALFLMRHPWCYTVAYYQKMRMASHSTYVILSDFLFGVGCLHGFRNTVVATAIHRRGLLRCRCGLQQFQRHVGEGESTTIVDSMSLAREGEATGPKNGGRWEGKVKNTPVVPMRGVATVTPLTAHL